MKTPALLLALALTFGCSRCDRTSAPTPDAGPAPSELDAGAAPTASATDLRSALFLMYPEFRQSVVRGGEVTFEEVSLRRKESAQVDGGTPLEALLSSLQKEGWTLEPAADAGVITAKNHPFQLSARLEDGRLTQTLTLPLVRSDVQAIFGSPTTPTTENLASRLGDVPGFTPAKQNFRFELQYRASSADKASVLITYQARNLLKTGWSLIDPLDAVLNPDAGLHTLPSPATIRLRQETTGGALNLSRTGDEVTIEYVQPIRAR